jgi:hypothetical protein
VIGNPENIVSSTVFPVLTNPTDPPDYYQPRWTVGFQDGTSVTIVDGSRAIVSYYIPRSPEPKASVRKAIPEANVLEIYRKLIDASGVDKTQLASPEASLSLSPCTTDTVWHDWDIYARRTYEGIPYDSQLLSVGLDAETGVVHSFYVRFGYPAPVADVLKMTKDQAIQTGKQFMIDNQITGSYVSCVLSVVQPNCEFAPQDQNNNGQWFKPGPAVVAWDCNFNDPNGWNTHIWFSVADGTVLGGGKVGHEPGFK